jgi:hypothetical protein
MRRFRELLDEARALPVRSPVVRQRLDDLQEAHLHLVEAIRELREAWQAKRAAESSATRQVG